jgi:hypothetical protein
MAKHLFCKQKTRSSNLRSNFTMPPKENGEIAEAKALAALKEKGYTVSIPFGENARYDVIIDDGELTKVQIKKGWKHNGGINFSTKSTSYNSDGGSSRSYTKSEIDCFVVVYEDSIYQIPIEETPSSIMKLRVDPPENNTTKSINFAENYEL